MSSSRLSRFLSFLHEELVISQEALSLGLRHLNTDASQLPIVLWQYGLLNLQQLSQAWDWLDKTAEQDG
jgi:hypothetical protein